MSIVHLMLYVSRGQSGNVYYQSLLLEIIYKKKSNIRRRMGNRLRLLFVEYVGIFLLLLFSQQPLTAALVIEF